MDIDNDTVRLVGRVLPPETLYFANGKSETIGPKGEWNRAATNSVLTAVSLTKWAIFFPEKNKAIVQNFCKELQRVASRMGIQMANPKVHIFYFKLGQKKNLWILSVSFDFIFREILRVVAIPIKLLLSGAWLGISIDGFEPFLSDENWLPLESSNFEMLNFN